MKEASIIYLIDGQSFYTFTKITCIGDLGVSCHTTNNDGLNDVTHIDVSVQGSFGSMAAMTVAKGYACKVLCKGRCKSFLVDLQTLARRKNI